MRRLLPVLAAALLGGCAWGLKAGPTDEGLAVSVPAVPGEGARRRAVESVLDLYLSPGARLSGGTKLEELLARPGRFVGREKARKGATLVEVKLGALGAALEEAGLLRPAGFPKGPGRVLIVLEEPAASLGAGYAADSMRRALAARGVSAADARDMLLARPTLRTLPAGEVAREAFAGGVDFVVEGRAAAEAAPDPETGAWRALAELAATLKTGSDIPGEDIEVRGAAVDVSSAAARAKALEQVGEEASTRVAAAMTAARAGREEVIVEVRGAGGVERLLTLIAVLRGLVGVKGAALGTHRDDEGAALVRVFCAGVRADELAARLLRADSTLVMLGIEAENRRVIVETGMREAL